MTSAYFPVPDNEKGRLRALQQYQLLDSLSENDCDVLTEMASRICQTKAAMITLLDEKKQYVKSSYGWNLREAPREHAICNYTILDPDRVNVVPDLRLDDRFRTNPFVTGDPHAVFYAGAPLVTPEGFVLGSLCVMDPQAKTLSKDQQEGLQALARQVITNMELRKKNEHLKTTRRQLKDSNKRLGELEKLVSHDMKTPLANITMLSKGFRGNYRDRLDAASDGYLELIQNSAAELIAFIDNLLHKNKTTVASKRSKRVNTREVLDKVIARIAPPEDIVIEIKGTFPKVPVNELALQQVFQNLITNAIRHNDKPRGVITILAEKDTQFHHFRFSDNGTGIAEENLEKIFEKQPPANSGRPGHRGAGIGLAQVKRIVESAGGNISVASKPNVGTDFRISLPQYN